MWVIDRSVLIIERKEAFLTWVRGLPDPDKVITLEEINEFPGCYLLPPFEEDKEAFECIEEVCSDIFAEEMSAWHEDEKDWEEDRSFKNFKKWFHYKICAMPVDMVEGEIEKEDY